MENYVNTGAHCVPRFGAFAGSGPVWPEQVGIKVATSAAAGSPDTAAGSPQAAAGSPKTAAGSHCAAVPSGRPVYRARFRTLVNPIGIYLPVTQLLHTSAPEP